GDPVSSDSPGPGNRPPSASVLEWLASQPGRAKRLPRKHFLSRQRCGLIPSRTIHGASGSPQYPRRMKSRALTAGNHVKPPDERGGPVFLVSDPQAGLSPRWRCRTLSRRRERRDRLRRVRTSGFFLPPARGFTRCRDVLGETFRRDPASMQSHPAKAGTSRKPACCVAVERSRLRSVHGNGLTARQSPETSVARATSCS